MRRLVAAALAALCAGPASADTRDTSLNGWFDLTVPGGPATLAALELHPDERALALPILARAIQDRHSRLGREPLRIVQTIQEAAVPAVGEVVDAATITVPAPLTSEIWQDLLAVQPHEDLFTRLIGDNAALLLAVGLMSADSSVRMLFSEDRDLLRSVYRQWVGPFAVVARSLRIADGQVVVPGGEHAPAVWRHLAGESPARPAAFIRSLVTRDMGRLAWYFDALANLDQARAEMVWPGQTPKAMRDSAEQLYDAFRQSDPQWRIIDQPYRRTFGDAASVLMLSDVVGGRLTGPESQLFWEHVFVGRPAETSGLDQGVRLTLPRLVRLISLSGTRDRRDRLEAFRLGQRVFPEPRREDLGDIASALRSYSRYRALLLSLERMGVHRPRTWAAVAAAARHIDDRANDRDESVTAFQASVALLDRIRHVRAIDPSSADRALQTLSDAVRRDDKVLEGIREWIKAGLMDVLPPLERPDAWTKTTSFESRILQALAGPRNRATPALAWEGLDYRVDVVAAEHDRLRAVRAQLPSPGLDEALSNARPRDLAGALTALAYAPALGEPDGAVALSREVAIRHDFGFGATNIVRELRPYALPEEQQGFGPWRVHGSLIGLDLGLSRLALRRISTDDMPPAPSLTLNDFATLTRTVVAMVPFDLTDADRGEIAQAIARGRRRVAEAAGAIGTLEELAREVRVSALTRQLIPWIAARQPESVHQIFSTRDMLWLGHPTLAPAALDRWGVAADAIDGRRTPMMPRPAPWEDFAGRADVGQITTQAPDLTLRVIEETARLNLPAVLVPSLLAFAMNDYWHDTKIRFADDWFSLVRQARLLDGTRVEDYVAALAGNGPLRAQ